MYAVYYVLNFIYDVHIGTTSARLEVVLRGNYLFICCCSPPIRDAILAMRATLEVRLEVVMFPFSIVK